MAKTFETPKKLKKVLLTKNDTCWSYAIKRTNLKTKCKTLSKIEDYFDLELFEKDKLNIGSIVIWNYNKKEVNVPYEITADGMILNRNVEVGVHVGVIEQINGDEILVSDATRTLSENFIPVLRMRYLDEIRKPDYIIVEKQVTQEIQL